MTQRLALVEGWDGTPALDGPLVRWDLAWPLYLPDQAPGTLAHDPDDAWHLARWFWERMGQVAGFLHTDGAPVVWLTAPRLEPVAREFVTRLASFWSEEVYWVDAAQLAAPPWQALENRWVAPALSVTDAPPAASAAAHFTLRAQGGSERFLGSLLGVGRAFMKVQVVQPGAASARLHSHSAADEYYLVVAGRGTLRTGAHRVPVEPGTLVGKPTGPDLPSQFVADQGEPLTVLDMEIWPDARLLCGVKEVAAYHDHGELYLHGPGWQAMAPTAALGAITDARAHYNEGYVRRADGTFAPLALPGMPARR